MGSATSTPAPPKEDNASSEEEEVQKSEDEEALKSEDEEAPQDEIVRLRQDVKDLNAVIDELLADVAAFELKDTANRAAAIIQWKSATKAHTEKNEALREKNGALEVRIGALSTKIEALKELNEALEEENKALEERLAKYSAVEDATTKEDKFRGPMHARSIADVPGIGEGATADFKRVGIEHARALLGRLLVLDADTRAFDTWLQSAAPTMIAPNRARCIEALERWAGDHDLL